MIGRRRRNVASSVDANLSLESINDFFRTVAISVNHQPASCFHSKIPVGDDHFRFGVVTDEVRYQLQHLDTRKSTGLDGISALFLKMVASEVADPLTFIFNQSLQTGIVPSAWKYSNVTPVHKGGDKSNPGNFRPISVVPVAAKVLERLIADQFRLYLESRHLLHDHQGAYRCGRSSDQILLFAVDKIVNALDCGSVVCAAFLDLRKAFDSLDHVTLLHRIQELGVYNVELWWFQNYLSDRYQRVRCGDSFSDWGAVKGGIPQGSALGPLLFLIYVNDMPDQVQHGVLLQFADDTCLICCGKSYEETSVLLTEDLTLLSQWIVTSHMQVNVNKSSVMWFYIKQSKRRAPPPSVYLGGLPLQQVDRHKYLGVFFDPQLRWDVHVNNICKKMSYYLYLVSYHRRQLPLHVLEMLMDSLVLSQFYALPVWGPSLGTAAMSRLQRLCNRAVWVTCGLRKYDHVSAARYSLGWLPFDLLIQHRALALMYRLYISDNCVQLDPPLHFGSNHTYGTRLSSHFCNIFRYSTAFGQKFFRSKAVMWWNSLPCSLFDHSFSCHLYKYLLNL